MNPHEPPPDESSFPTILTTDGASPAAAEEESPSATPMPGADNYVLGAEIARGGMGSILEAEDAKLKRTVAAKIMRFDANADDSVRQRFVREAEVLALLAHPNIVPIYDIVWEDGLPLFYTMKLVKGRTLQAILNEMRKEGGPGVPAAGAQITGGTPVPHFTLDRLLLAFCKVCDAISFAHSKGIIHRDLKPDNIMVGEFGEVLVMDWGLAKMLGVEGSRVESQSHETAALSTLNPQLSSTLQGMIMGTPQYMSPEQAQGDIDELDGRSDIFSLGGILYAILTLRPPVEGATIDEVLTKVRSALIAPPDGGTRPPGALSDGGPPGALSNTHAGGDSSARGEKRARRSRSTIHGGRVPAALSAVVMKALRLAKEERYQTVAELSADVEKYQGGFATSAEQAGAWKQLRLLMLRHKAVTASLAALLLISAGFLIKVMASERKATRNAEIATANEKRAVANGEQARRALAASQVALAEAAFRSVDLPAMVRALDSVPRDLRDQRWDYLSVKRDSSLGEFRVEGLRKFKAIAAIPGHAAQFAIADGRGVIGIVNMKTGVLLHSISTDLRGEVALAISADGARLAVTQKGAPVIHFYRTADGRRDGTVPAPGTAITQLRFSADGRLLAVLDHSPKKNHLCVVDAKDGAVRWQLHGDYMDAIFSPDGARIFAGIGRDLQIIGTAKGDVIRSQDVFLNSIAMSRDGRRLALGLRSGEVMIMDVATGLETQRVRLHLSRIHGLTWTAGGQLLTVGGEGESGKGRRVMRLWETEGFLARGTFFGIEEGPIGAGWDFNPESGHLLMGQATPRLWRIPAGIEAARWTGKAERGWATGFLSDTVLLARKDFTMGAFDVANPRAIKESPQTGPRGYLAIAPWWPGGLVALAKRTGEAPTSIKIFSTAGGVLAEKRDIPTPGRIDQMDWDAAGARLVAAGVEPGAFILDPHTGETLLKLPQEIKQAVFAGGSGHLAAIVLRKREADDVQDDLTLFDSKSGQLLKSVSYHQRLISLAVSPDRRLVAIGGADMIVRVLDAETLEERFAFRAHDAEISALAFHPKKPVLASGAADGTVKLWDYESARLRESFIGFTGAPVSIAFSPNGRLLSVESAEPTGRLFVLGQD